MTGQMIGKRVTMVSAALALAACGSEQSETLEMSDGSEATYTVDAEAGDASLSISGDDGAQITIDGGDDVATDLPDGFALYPGARAVSSTLMQQSDGSGVLLVMETADSPEKLVAFYRAQAEDVGIVIDTEMNSAGQSMIAGESPDGRIFSFNASPSGDKSVGQLLVGRSQ